MINKPSQIIYQANGVHCGVSMSMFYGVFVLHEQLNILFKNGYLQTKALLFHLLNVGTVNEDIFQRLKSIKSSEYIQHFNCEYIQLVTHAILSYEGHNAINCTAHLPNIYLKPVPYLDKCLAHKQGIWGHQNNVNGTSQCYVVQSTPHPFVLQWWHSSFV